MLDNLYVQLALAFGAGLVVGWNFLSQPQFVKDIIDKIFKKTS